MTITRRHALHLLLSGAIVLLLLVFARGVDWRGAGAALRTADPTLLVLAIVANLVSLALKGIRWWVFLRPLGVRSLSLVLRATFAGASLNNLLVAQGGEGARVLLVSRSAGVSSARVLAALAMERVLDAVSYLVLLVGAAWLLELPHAVARWRMAASAVLAAVTLALITLVIAARRSSARNGSPADATLGSDLAENVAALSRWSLARIGEYTRRFASGIAELASASRLAVGMALSIGAWALQVATYHLCARAAHLPLSLAGSIAALLVVGVSFLVRATPGNVGVFQMVYALTARSFGLPEAPAVAVALLIQTIQVLPTIAVGTLVAPRLVDRRKVRRT
jgi:uncharacterized protein (TIRG00374 family)